MKASVLLRKFSVSTAVAAVVLAAAPAFAQKCRVVEYAELKDMSTDELIQLGDSFVSGLELRQLSLKFDLEYSILSKDPKLAIQAQSEARDIDQCLTEAQRVAGLAKKRKDLKKTVTSGFYPGGFVARYKLK